MNLSKKRLDLVFFITLFLTLFVPEFRLVYFAPFIIILIYKKPLTQALWGALACGVILDLLSSDARIGMHALTYAIATWAIYPLKRNFFADTITTLPIMTFFFAALSTFVELVLRFSFNQATPIHLSWIMSDLIIFPLLDAAFAFIIFVIPPFIFGKRQMSGKDYFTED